MLAPLGEGRAPLRFSRLDEAGFGAPGDIAGKFYSVTHYAGVQKQVTRSAAPSRLSPGSKVMSRLESPGALILRTLPSPRSSDA